MQSTPQFKEYQLKNHDFEVQGTNILLLDDDNKIEVITPEDDNEQIRHQGLTLIDQDCKIISSRGYKVETPLPKTNSDKPTGLAKIFSNLVVQQNISLFKDKLTFRKKLLDKLKYRHHKIINDKSFDINQFEPDESDETDDYLHLIIGTKTIKIMKRQINQMKKNILRSRPFQRFNEFLENLLTQIPIITPESQSKWIWDIILGLIRIYYLIMIPIHLAFNNYILSNSSISFTILSSILIIFDIIIRLDTAFFKMGVLQTSRWEIFKQYYNNGLISDILSVLALLFINISNNLSIQDKINPDTTKRNIIDFAQLVFFSQLSHLKVLKRQAEEVMNLSIGKISAYNIVKLLFTLLLIEHFFSCVWAFIGLLEYENDYPSWLVHRGQEQNYWLYQYLESIYYMTVTMITVGYGDIVPISPVEKIFCILFMIFSSVQLSYSVNLVGHTITSLMSESEASLKKMRILNQYLRRKGINEKLKNQIREYLIYFWAGQHNQNSEEQFIIDQLSEQLKGQLDYECNNALFDCCSYWKRNFSDTLINELSKYVKSFTIQPDNFIEMNQPDKPDNTYYYYIESGSVQENILTHDTNNPLVTKKRIRSSHNFGLQEFFQGSNSDIKYKSIGFTKLLQLARDDFLQVIERHPKDYENFCLLRDKIFLQQKQIKKQKCGYCKKFEHSIAQCPAFHLIPDKEKILKSHIFPQQQERDQLSTRSTQRYKVFNSLVDKFMVIQTVEKFIADLDNPYLSDSDDNEEFSLSDQKQRPFQKKILAPLNLNLQRNQVDVKELTSRIIQKGPKQIAHYKQKLKQNETDKFELLYLKLKNNQDEEINNIQYDSMMNFKYYLPKYNAEKVISKYERRKILNRVNGPPKDKFIRYMLFPFNFRMKYQIPFEQSKEPEILVLSSVKSAHQGQSKKKDQNKLAVFVSQVRKNQVVPSNNQREQSRKQTKRVVSK